MYTYNLNVYEFYVFFFFKTMAASLALEIRNVFEKPDTYSYIVWLINEQYFIYDQDFNAFINQITKRI